MKPKDGNGGKKGEPPNQRRRTARLRGDDARMEKLFRQMEREEKRMADSGKKKSKGAPQKKRTPVKPKGQPPNRSKTPTQSRKDSLYFPGSSKEREGMRDLVEKGEPPSNRKRAQTQQNKDRMRGKPLRGEKSKAAVVKTRSKGEPPGRARTRKFRVTRRG